MFAATYKRYVLGALTLVYALNAMDRSLITLMLQPIKDDLHLTDTQLGFLTGIAFSLFYATLGVPVARWADRGNRATITSIAIGLWGATVMVCMFVTNFGQLVFARVAAGVGEAGCMPPTYSLIGDYFPKSQERTRAMAVYLLGSPLAFFVSFLLGGYLNELFGWRVAFLVMGVPGLLVAALVKLTIIDPRTLAAQAENPTDQWPRMNKVFIALWQQRSSRHLGLAIILLHTMGFGLSPWYAAFMIRSHGMHTSELGVWLGLIFGLGGVTGILLGSYVTVRWFPDDEQMQMRLSAVVLAALVPGFAMFLLLPQSTLAMGALLLVVLASNFIFGPAFALLQRLVADEMRATTLAVVMLFVNLIGMGIGPQIVGILSDLLMPHLGRESLRYAMLVMSFVSLWAGYHFWMVGGTVQDDLHTWTRARRLAEGQAA